jgi:hypothetical protein
MVKFLVTVWKDHLVETSPRLLDNYKGLTGCNLGSGPTVFFWSDLWLDECLCHKFPHLLSFAKNTDMSVYEVVNAEFLEDLFHLLFSNMHF